MLLKSKDKMPSFRLWFRAFVFVLFLQLPKINSLSEDAMLLEEEEKEKEREEEEEEGGGSRRSDHCEMEIFNATCPTDHVVVMTHALYGRMRLSRCVRLDYGHVGCSADVLSALDARCSGRQRCELRIPDAELARKKPCPDDLKPYLEAAFRCVKVVWPSSSSSSADVCSGVHSLSADSGTLSSLVSDATGCGAAMDSPWRIEVAPGQTIDVTLYDFSVQRARQRASSSSITCFVYGHLWESDDVNDTAVVCGGMERVKHVYSTRTNHLRVAFSRPHPVGRSAAFFFLLRYRAVGCTDLPLFSSNSWSVRSGNIVSVRCNFTKDVYHLKCSGSTWIGDSPNCSSSSATFPLNSGNPSAKATPLQSYGVSLAIVIVIAIVMGNIVLLIGTTFLKRRQQNVSSAADSSTFLSRRCADAAAASTDREADASLDDHRVYLRCKEHTATVTASVDAAATTDHPTASAPAPLPLPPPLPLQQPTYGAVEGPTMRMLRPPSYLPCGCRRFQDDNDMETAKYRLQEEAMGDSSSSSPGEAFHLDTAVIAAHRFLSEDDSNERRRRGRRRRTLYRQNSMPPSILPRLPCRGGGRRGGSGGRWSQGQPPAPVEGASVVPRECRRPLIIPSTAADLSSSSSSSCRCCYFEYDAQTPLCYATRFLSRDNGKPSTPLAAV